MMKNKLATASLIVALFAPSIGFSQQLDYQCQSDCVKRYTYAYCNQVCAIAPRQSPPITVGNPAGAFIEGRRARQEADRRELELERMRMESQRMQEETERMRREHEAEQARRLEQERIEQENRRLKEELEALKSKDEDTAPQ